MLSKLFAAMAMGVAAVTIVSAYTQRSAFRLRQENQANHWPRRGTILSGRYRREPGYPYRCAPPMVDFGAAAPVLGK